MASSWPHDCQATFLITTELLGLLTVAIAQQTIALTNKQHVSTIVCGTIYCPINFHTRISVAGS